MATYTYDCKICGANLNSLLYAGAEPDFVEHREEWDEWWEKWKDAIEEHSATHCLTRADA